jgi:hypothetical protein
MPSRDARTDPECRLLALGRRDTLAAMFAVPCIAAAELTGRGRRAGRSPWLSRRAR